MGDASTYLVFGKTLETSNPSRARRVVHRPVSVGKDGHDTIDADSTSVRVTLEGRKDEQVQPFDIEVKRVTSAPAPREGLHIACPGQGAQPNITSLAIDLDEPSPKANAKDSSGKPVPLLFTVKEGESEIFDVSAFTAECDCCAKQAAGPY